MRRRAEQGQLNMGCVRREKKMKKTMRKKERGQRERERRSAEQPASEGVHGRESRRESRPRTPSPSIAYSPTPSLREREERNRSLPSVKKATKELERE